MDSSSERNQFGTFGGVFTPSILTILGVIMFMRTGYVVGEAGVINAVLILVIAKSITLLTSLSISAVSTNTQVEGGGAYFLISRSLGPAFGGAIGLALFVAQAFSVPFYILGFVEALCATAPALVPYALELGLGTTFLLLLINWFGASWAIKAQYAILAALVGAIVILLGGAGVELGSASGLQMGNLHGTFERETFWTCFAIFFPAVTGIMTGVNMSGDLKEPSKSIPSGTLYAVGVGFLIYLAQILVTGFAFERSELVETPYNSLLEHALFGLAPLIVLGVCAASLSSALGSLMGAPRILQALARDDIFTPLKPFGVGTEKGDEPRRGLVLTALITAIVLVGTGGGGGEALNQVASLLSMFFLYTYGMTNVAAFTEVVSGNPSFRPRFRFFHWSSALAGALGCGATALLIDPVAAFVALVVVIGVFIYVERKVLESSFGDARRGFVYARVRSSLFNLAAHHAHPKNWRPTTLVLSGNPTTRLTLTRCAAWMASGRGIVSLSQILIGDVHELAAERRQARGALQQYIEENALNAFPEVVVAQGLDEGISLLLQAHSIGPLKPNMVVSGWSARVERAEALVRHLHLAQDLAMSQVVVVDGGSPPIVGRRHIDVWWRGRRNGSLMLILAWLITRNWEWKGTRLRLLRVADEAELDGAQQEILTLLEAARIDVEVKVVQGSSFQTALREESSDAALVLLGFEPPALADAAAWHSNYQKLLEEMPTTLLVHSSGDADLLA